MKKNIYLAGLALTLLAAAPLTSSLAANGPVDVGNFTINVVDPEPLLGFSDPTPAAPVGGNTGTTVGDQRLEAYIFVVGIWDSILDVNTQIVLQASFTPLTCEADAGVLGAAGALNIFRDFPGPSFPSTWYGAALANNLSKQDLNGSTPDPGLLEPPFNDEIVSFFNANLGSTGCLENSAWYYGLDNNPPAGAIDFINTLAHEVGHGLGFQNFADDNTGQNFFGFPDHWSRFQRDNLLGKRWDQMVDFVRAFSETNGPFLVWSGPNVTTEAPNVLGPALVIGANAPGDIAGEEYATNIAAYGATIPPMVTGNVVLADDGSTDLPPPATGGTITDGCQALVNGGAIKDNIALIDRGGCNFTVKSKNAQDAGAIAVIIANNAAGGLPPLGGSDATVTLLTVGSTQAAGQRLREFSGTNVTLGALASDGSLSGTNGGLVRLYAPSPVQQGSSVSHFDISANPNLLMEPSITGTLQAASGEVDLTDDLLRDIGWAGKTWPAAIHCPVDANNSATISVLTCGDTGVENRKGEYVVIPAKGWLPGKNGQVAGGCYLADVIDACTPLVTINGQFGQYQSCIAQVTSDLVQQGHLTGDEKSAIQSCAASGK